MTRTHCRSFVLLRPNCTGRFVRLRRLDSRYHRYCPRYPRDEKVSNGFNHLATRVENFLSHSCNILSIILSILKYNPTRQIINLLLLNNFYPVVSYRRKKKKAKIYCLQFGHSLWSAISCQRKWLNIVGNSDVSLLVNGRAS